MITDNEIYSYILMLLLIPQLIICFWISGELFGLAKNIEIQETEKTKAINQTEELSNTQIDIE